jgi:hypothetical protein
MRGPLTKSQSGALALLLAFIICIYALIIQPYFQWQSDVRGDIQQTSQNNTKLQQRIRALQDEVALRPANPDRMIFWPAQKSGEASARIQSILGTLSTKTAVALKSITPLPAAAFSQEGTIGARIEVEAPLDQFLEFLLQLEYHEPPLVIEKSNIRRLVRPTSVQSQPYILAQLDIAAMFEAEGAEQ